MSELRALAESRLTEINALSRQVSTITVEKEAAIEEKKKPPTKEVVLESSVYKGLQTQYTVAILEISQVCGCVECEGVFVWVWMCVVCVYKGLQTQYTVAILEISQVCGCVDVLNDVECEGVYTCVFVWVWICVYEGLQTQYTVAVLEISQVCGCTWKWSVRVFGVWGVYVYT